MPVRVDTLIPQRVTGGIARMGSRCNSGSTERLNIFTNSQISSKYPVMDNKVLAKSIYNALKTAYEFEEAKQVAIQKFLEKHPAPANNTSSRIAVEGKNRVLPDKECIPLGRSLVLQITKEPYGLFYFESGQCKFQRLSLLQVRIIRYLYDIRNTPSNLRYKGVSEIASALTSTSSSISNQIKKLNDTLKRKGITVLVNTTRSKWTFNPELS